jgi:PleD family two-component response regulator
MSLQSTEDLEDVSGLSPKERLLHAKADHYLQLAEDCIRMSRFHAARTLATKVLAIDPANDLCKDLQSAIDERLLRLSLRVNGVHSNGPNGNKIVGRRRRAEIILIVDQDEQLLASLTDALQRFGFETLGACGYEEAVETLSLIPPDVVISEVNFENGPKGFELYQWVKTNLAGREIPFLYLAARIDRETLIAGKRFGVDDFLGKPADTEVIIASIMNCLSRRRAPAHMA